MKSKVSRSLTQRLASALTIMIVGLPLLHGGPSTRTGAAPGQDVKAIARQVRHTPNARPGVFKVDFDFDPYIFRHPVS